MKEEYLIIGNKYVPHQKTGQYGYPLEQSSVWNQSKKQGYMYFTGKDGIGRLCFDNTYTKGQLCKGDIFSAEDVEPYLKEVPSHILKNEEIKYVKLKKGWGAHIKVGKNVTKGKIYTFPNFILDNGKKLDLNIDFYSNWTQEFEISNEEEYNKQNKIEKMNSEIQIISKAGLEEIHQVACSTWKNKIEKLTLRNPFGNSIELTGKEVEEMFNASNPDQKEVLSKFLKENTKEIDLTSGKVDGKQLFEQYGNQDNTLIAVKGAGSLLGKSFYLNNKYNWELRQEGDVKILIPTRK